MVGVKLAMSVSMTSVTLPHDEGLFTTSVTFQRQLMTQTPGSRFRSILSPLDRVLYLLYFLSEPLGRSLDFPR